MERTHITWEAPEYAHREKKPDWLWSVGIVGVSAATAIAIFGNILFAALVLIATVALLLQSMKRPRVFSYALDRRGVHINTRLYPYMSLEGFWIDDDLAETRLLIKSQKILMPLIVIPLPDSVDVGTVHETLEQHLDEEELHEPFFEKLFERFGF